MRDSRFQIPKVEQPAGFNLQRSMFNVNSSNVQRPKGKTVIHDWKNVESGTWNSELHPEDGVIARNIEKGQDDEAISKVPQGSLYTGIRSR